MFNSRFNVTYGQTCSFKSNKFLATTVSTNYIFFYGRYFLLRHSLLCLAVISINRNRNRKLQISKAHLKSQAQGTSLFTSAASNHRGFPKHSPWEALVWFPYGVREEASNQRGFPKSRAYSL